MKPRVPTCLFTLSVLCPMAHAEPPRSATSIAGSIAPAPFRRYPIAELGLDDYLRRSWQSPSFALTHRQRADRLAVEARLDLRVSSALPPQAGLSSLAILVNGVSVAELPAADLSANSRHIIPIDASLLGAQSSIELRFLRPDDRRSPPCVPAGTYAVISPDSALQVRETALPASWTLRDLPLPFFDPTVESSARVPFVFASAPSPALVRVAFVLAGRMALFEGARPVELSLPVSYGALPEESGVVIARGHDLPALGLAPLDGAGVDLLPHPTRSSEGARVLVVWGDSDEALLQACERFVGSLPVAPAVADPNDGPSFDLRAGHLVRLREVLPDGKLAIEGRRSGVLKLHFRLPPGISFWPDRVLPFTLVYRQALAGGRAGSKIVVTLNGHYVATVQPAGARPSPRREVSFPLPQPLLRADNELAIYSEFPASADVCPVEHPEESTRVELDSRFDLRQAIAFTPLPDLARFVGEGFPFARSPSLAESAIVLPDPAPTGALTTVLSLGGHLGRLAGTVGNQVEIVSPADVERVARRDLLVVGAVPDLPLLASWRETLPIGFASDGISVRRKQPLARTLSAIRHLVDRLGNENAEPREAKSDVATASFESPLASGRAVVLLTALDDAALARSVSLRRRPIVEPGIDIILDGKDRSQSFRGGDGFYVGDPGRWQRTLYFLSQHPLPLLPLVLVAAAALALAIRLATTAHLGRRLRP